MALNVVTTNNQTGVQTVNVHPVGVDIGIVYTLSLFGVEVSYEAVAATANDVVLGLQAAIAASLDAEWSNCTTEVSADGETLLISYSVTAGDLKLWRGDAPAVAQVTRMTPVDVIVGGQYSCQINGKSITVIATVASAASVAALLLAAINDSDIPEFQEVTAEVSGGSVILTASTAGVPFTLEPGAGNGTVAVTRVTDGFLGSNAIQTLPVPVTLTGTWTVTWDDETTSAIAAGASDATVETALEALAAIGSGNVSVTRTTSDDGNDYLYAVEFVGALASRPIAPMVLDAMITGAIVRRTQTGSATGEFLNEIQTLQFPDGVPAAGVYVRLTKDAVDTSVFPITNDGDAFASIINGISTVTRNVTGSRTTGTGIYEPNVVTLEFSDLEGNATQSLLESTLWLDGGGTPTGLSYSVRLTPRTDNVGEWSYNETQQLQLIGEPTGGTFSLYFGGQTTAAIAYNASAGTVETAFELLSSVGSGNGTVTGSSGGPWTVEFTGSKAAQPLELIASTSALTGGATDSVTVVTTSASRGPNHWDDARNWSPVGVPVDFDRVRFESGKSDCLYGLDQSEIILTEIEFKAAYTGSVGLPRDNADGYREYRMRELTINCPSILIGYGEGSGSGKIQLNTLETTVYMEIRATGSSREQNVPAVTWFGDNQASEIILYNGEFGVAVWSDQTAVLNKIEQYGGTLSVFHCTGSYLYVPGQKWSGHEIVFGLIEA